MEVPPNALVVDPDNSSGFLERFATPTRRHIVDPHITELRFVEHPNRLFLPSFATLSEIAVRHQNVVQCLVNVATVSVRSLSSNGLRGALHWILSARSTIATLKLSFGRNVELQLILCSLRELQDSQGYLKTFEFDIDTATLSLRQRFNLAIALMDLCAGRDALRGSLRKFSVPGDILEVAWDQCLNSISQLPALEEFTISRRSSSLTAKNLPQAPRRIKAADDFPNLRAMTVFAPLSVCASVLQATSCTAITELHLRAEYLQDAQEMHSALQVVGNSCPRLTDLAIVIEQADPTNSVWVNLRPLLNAKHIRSLSVQYPYPLIYTSDELRDMLTNWTRIESLCLNPRPTSGYTTSSGPLPTLQCLAAVAQTGPLLKNFHAMLDCRFPLDTHMLSIPSYAPESLVLLDLGHSLGSESVEDLENTALCIIAYFPRAQMVVDDSSEWVKGLQDVVASEAHYVS